VAHALGVRGERHAEQYLLARGARILARNFGCAFGELDLVVDWGGDLVAVEVKTRTEGCLESPLDALTPWKLRRLARALTAYALDTHYPDCQWRIDAILIDVDALGNVIQLEHLKSIYEEEA
jgi:putative endonuclease